MLQPVANFALCQKLIIECTRNIMMDTLEVVRDLGEALKMIHSCTFYCVSLISDIANCIFRP